MITKRKYILIGAASVLFTMQTMTSFAADGTWMLTDAGYTFTYSDGRKACGTWEDIDGTISTEMGSWRLGGRTSEISDIISTGTVLFPRVGSMMVPVVETGTIMTLRETRRSSGLRMRESGTGLMRTER